MGGESEGLFEAVFDALPLPALTVDRTGLVMAANAAFAPVFGPAPLGRPLTDLCADPLDGHLILAGLKAGRALEPEPIALKAADGLVHARVKPASAGGARGVVLLECEDAVETRPAAQSLDGAYALDFGGGSCLVSGVFAAGLDVGAQNGETASALFLDAIHPEDRARLDEALAAAGPEPFATARFVCRMRGARGGWVEVRHRVQIAAREPDGRPRRITGVARAAIDATARDAVADRPDAIAEAVLASEHGAWTLDLATGSVRFSAAARTLLGIDAPGPLTLSDWRDLLHPDDVEQCVNGVAAMAEGALMECCYRVRRPDGGEVWIEDKGRLTERGPDGAPLIAQGLIADVTARKQLEEELKRYAAQLERSQRELERFSQVAAHDLQEPVRKIAAFSMLLQRKYADAFDPEGAQALEFLGDAARRMRALIDDLLAYTRASSRALATAPVDLNALALKASALALEEAGRPEVGVEIGELPELIADADLLEALLVNLISNAIKYRSAEAPMVWVSAEQLDGGRDGVRLTVRDNGIGLDPKFAEKIFQPFARLHAREAFPGTGIGLAICEQAAERHGGRIWVESEPGEGAAFHVELPGATRRAGAAA